MLAEDSQLRPSTGILGSLFTTRFYPKLRRILLDPREFGIAKNPTRQVDHENEWPANGSSRTFQGYGCAHRENEHIFKARKTLLISWQYFIVGKCREVEFKILSLTFRASVGCFTKHLHALRIHQGLLELTLCPAKDFYNLLYLPSCCEYFNLSIYFLKTVWFLGRIFDVFSWNLSETHTCPLMEWLFLLDDSKSILWRLFPKHQLLNGIFNLLVLIFGQIPIRRFPKMDLLRINPTPPRRLGLPFGHQRPREITECDLLELQVSLVGLPMQFCKL